MKFFVLETNRKQWSFSAEFAALLAFLAVFGSLFWGFVHHVGPVLLKIAG